VSLADLLTALALVGMVMGGTLTLLRDGQQAAALAWARVEAQQSARVALERLAREIRQAGRGLSDGEAPAISVAEPSRIVIHVDLDGDGRSTAGPETVTWLLRDGVLRRSAGGGAQPIINGARDLVFTYRDAQGEPTAEAEAVRAVGITLMTGPADALGSPGRRTLAVLSTEVRLRNR
jgi:type II secretory pathway pseudopilin PulG